MPNVPHANTKTMGVLYVPPLRLPSYIAFLNFELSMSILIKIKHHQYPETSVICVCSAKMLQNRDQENKKPQGNFNCSIGHFICGT